ncbi:MAG: hypothetical protein LBG44_02280 [Gemmatimonadota bacterium]|nr:hypothetical protein [Gemmatimonadota bacterium]
MFRHLEKKPKLFREYWRGALWAAAIHGAAFLVLALIADRVAEAFAEGRAAAAERTTAYGEWATKLGGDSIVFMEIPPLFDAPPADGVVGEGQPLFREFESLLMPAGLRNDETGGSAAAGNNRVAQPDSE